MTKKLELGDCVEVINYGSKYFVNKSDFLYNAEKLAQSMYELDYRLIWGTAPSEESVKAIKGYTKPSNILKESDTHWICDMNPEMVGIKGTIDFIAVPTPNYPYPKYSLTGIKGKTAWYNEDQLKLCEK